MSKRDKTTPPIFLQCKECMFRIKRSRANFRRKTMEDYNKRIDSVGENGMKKFCPKCHSHKPIRFIRAKKGK